MNRSLLTVVGSVLVGAVAGALIYSAYLQPKPGVHFCLQPKNHCIKVTIDASASPPVLSVDVPVLKKKGTNHSIFWLLDNDTGQSYYFPSDGIAFKDAAGQAQFPGCGIFGGDNHVFRCKDTTGTPGTYDYGVTVTAASTTPPIPAKLDPQIVNN